MVHILDRMEGWNSSRKIGKPNFIIIGHLRIRLDLDHNFHYQDRSATHPQNYLGVPLPHLGQTPPLLFMHVFGQIGPTTISMYFIVIPKPQITTQNISD